MTEVQEDGYCTVVLGKVDVDGNDTPEHTSKGRGVGEPLANTLLVMVDLERMCTIYWRTVAFRGRNVVPVRE